jgi:hypothetical protein
MQPCHFTGQGNPPLLNKQPSYILILVALVLPLELPCLKTLWKAINKRKSLGENSSPPCCAGCSFIHHGLLGKKCIISIQIKKKKCKGTFFLTDLSLYSSDSCSEIAGSFKDAR